MPIMSRVSEQTVVVGAGAIGLSTAYWLAAAGVPVRVVDRGAVGQGASAGNGGWVNRSDAVPLPAPGIARYALSKVGRGDSPLYVQPRADARQLLWLLRFALHCRRRPYERAAAALTALARPAAELYEQLQQAGVAFTFRRVGHLHVFADAQRAQDTLAAAALLARFGYDAQAQALTGEEVRALEPIIGEHVRAGVLFPREGHVDPLEFTCALAARLEAMGVRIDTGVEVRALASTAGRVTGCLTPGGLIPARQVVIAAGVGSRVLAGACSKRLPIAAGKGYSFSLKLSEPVGRTILLGDSKVGLTPLGQWTRVLGTMEFSDERVTLRRSRIDAMLVAARRYLRGVPATVDASSVGDAWAGLRPMTPDGLPILDRCRTHDNVFVVTGHGMLGMMLGPATGQAVAQFIRSGARPRVLVPFAIDRFASRSWSPVARPQWRCL
jgi:D-amino-acid dehydrogenase